MIDLSRIWRDFWDTVDASGAWKMVVLSPHNNKPLTVEVEYNPWTGERLK